MIPRYRLAETHTRQAFDALKSAALAERECRQDAARRYRDFAAASFRCAHRAKTTRLFAPEMRPAEQAGFDDFKARMIGISFSLIVQEELAGHLAEIRERNASTDYGVGACATHDFCDANILMEQAFRSIMHRECDPASDSDAQLWNAAWNHAIQRGFET